MNKEKIEVPIKGMSKQTFVRGYKVNSKMDANRINGVNLSGHAGRLIESLYDIVSEPFAINTGGVYEIHKKNRKRKLKNHFE